MRNNEGAAPCHCVNVAEMLFSNRRYAVFAMDGMVPIEAMLVPIGKPYIAYYSLVVLLPAWRSL